MNRNEAISSIAKYELALLNKEEREKHILDFWSIDENDKEFHNLPEVLQKELLNSDEPVYQDIMESRYNSLIVESLKYSYNGVTNEYLSKKIKEFIGKSVIIEGKVDTLLPCPCCYYKTLEKRGYYDICPVCEWEDDGNDDLYKHSSPNQMSISEYRTKMKISDKNKYAK